MNPIICEGINNNINFEVFIHHVTYDFSYINNLQAIIEKIGYVDLYTRNRVLIPFEIYFDYSFFWVSGSETCSLTQAIDPTSLIGRWNFDVSVLNKYDSDVCQQQVLLPMKCLRGTTFESLFLNSRYEISLSSC